MKTLIRSPSFRGALNEYRPFVSQNEVMRFNILYRQQVAMVKEHSIGTERFFSVIFDKQRERLLVGKIPTIDHRFRWVSFPAGRELEATGVGKLILLILVVMINIHIKVGK